MSRFADGMAARTRFFDDFFATACDAGGTKLRADAFTRYFATPGT